MNKKNPIFKDVKNTFRYAKCALFSELYNTRTFFIYIVLFVFLFDSLHGITQVLRAKEYTVNIFEMYISAWNTLSSKTILIIILMFLLSIKFFFEPGVSYYLVRSNKKSWLFSQYICIVMIVLFYNISIILISAIVCEGMVNFSDSWSGLSLISGINMTNLSYIEYIRGLEVFSPNFVGLVTLALNVVEGIVIGFIMVYCMMVRKQWMAFLIVNMCYLAEYVCGTIIGKMSIIDIVWRYVCPIRTFLPEYRISGEASVSIGYSITYFIILIISLYAVTKYTINKVDFMK